jgi:hypothetical protein
MQDSLPTGTRRLPTAEEAHGVAPPAGPSGSAPRGVSEIDHAVPAADLYFAHLDDQDPFAFGWGAVRHPRHRG